MKTLIFLLFYFFIRFNLFAEEPIGEAREAGYIKEPEQTSSAIAMLDAIDAKRRQTGNGVPWRDPDIPPPITNNFYVIFPRLYGSDNYLIMTNAQYSGRSGRRLTFTQFTSMGCASVYLDVTAIHAKILDYLKISKARVIQEDKEMTRKKAVKALNRLEQERRKLEKQISAMALMDATDQLNAVDAACNTGDAILNMIDVVWATIDTMDMTDQMKIHSAEKETVRAALDTTQWAQDTMREMLQEQAKERAEMLREYLRASHEKKLIRQSRPKSMIIQSTEECIDEWGNRYSVPKSSVVEFEYDD